MLTKRSIIVKNQFTTKNNSTRGSTPVNFVKDYMLRNDATLTVYPVTKDNQPVQLNEPNVFNKQTQTLISKRKHYDPNKVTPKDWFDLTTLEGRGFDNNNLSMSKADTDKRANQMQALFKQGHTVHKLVISFDNDYLKNLGVERGDNFKKDIDEMKLRLAVSRGMQQMAKTLNYSDPLFIGTIQLDRDHPHAHIVLAEQASKSLSQAKRAKDGTEYGLIGKRVRQETFNAIDQSLNLTRDLEFMSSDATYNLQNQYKKYTKNYSVLPTQTKLMALKTAKDLHYDDIQFSLTRSLSKTYHKNERKLNQQVNNQMPLKDAPVGVDIALNNLLHNPNNRFYRRKKRHKKTLLDEKDAFEKLKYFENLSINDEDNSKNIKKYILPYLVSDLIDKAGKVDKIRKHLYRKRKKITHQDKLKLQLYQTKTTNSLLQAAKDNDLQKQSLKWHQQGKINAQDFINSLSGAIPTPKPTVKLSNFPNINLKQPQILAKQAASNLPQTDIEAYKLTNMAINTNNSELEPKKLTNKHKHNSKKAKIKHYKTIDLKHADDMMFNSNF